MTTHNIEITEIKNNILKEKNLFTCNGNINSAYINKLNFLESKLFKDILDFTNFLKDSSSFSERIYCINNYILERKKCLCGKELRFITFQVGYKNSCSKCFRKINRKWKSPSEVSNINITKEKEELFNYILDKNSLICSDQQMMDFILNKTRIISKCYKYISRTDIKTNKPVLKSLFLKTKYIPLDKENFKWANRIYDILHETYDGQLCKICKINKTRFINLKKGYSTCCSNIECGNEYGSKNRTINHIETISPSLLEQGFEVINIENYNGLNANKTELLCNKCNTKIKCDISDGKWKHIRCYNCYGKNGISYEEKEVSGYVKKYESDVLDNCRIFKNSNKELDVYIPNKKLGIEYNGDLWHSFGINFPNNIKDEYKNRNNHFDKYKKCKELNINLLQINSHEWNNSVKQNIWKSIINNKLKINNKIYARKCKIVELTNKQKNDFLNKNHLQGMDNSKIKLGLEYENEIVSVMTFSKPRFNKNYEWELVRFCSLLNNNVIGGASKLFNYFVKNYNPKNIISYADLRYSNGNLYEKLGFNFKAYTPPSYVYIKDGHVLSRFSCQKHNLCKILENFDEKQTESQNMLNNNYRKMWDAGTMLVVFNK